MNTRTTPAAGILAAAFVLVASVAGASEPMKRYTFPAAPASQVVSPGTLTVLLPAGWAFSDDWAAEPVDKLRWDVSARLEGKATTLAGLRVKYLAQMRSHTPIHGWRDVWGWENGLKFRQVGDTYVTLPVGKAWRFTQLLVGGDKPSDWAARQSIRTYFVDGGAVREAGTGAEKELFLTFDVRCGYRPSGTVAVNECKTHNDQFEAIMRSIRYTP